ncbi:MAG TPA: PKD domain-containing protein, partial [Kiritimatiellia bacterium]|nr:PKD domain-containing protein [Kiritimatiellia bacterium]
MLGRCVRKSVAGALALFGSVPALSAATLHVDPACPTPAAPFDDWSNAATNIQQALDAAGEGDVVLVTNGTYVVGSQLVLARAVSLVSVNGADATRIHAVSNRCLLATAPATIDGFAFTNGYVAAAPVFGAGIYAPATGAVVRNCRFENNYCGANGQGGGLWLGPSGTVENCVFSRNRADVGGGLFASNGLALAGCTFTGNWTSAGSGGGVFATGGASVTNCGFFANQAGGGTSSQGGGAFCSWTTNAAVWIRNCRFEGNASKAQGGAVAIRRGGIVEDSVFLANVATNEGGAAYFDDTNCCIRRCELRRNAALGGGGAIYGRSQVVGCLVVSNRAANGGGLYAMNTMQVEDTVVQDNLAGSGGGLYGSGAVVVRNGLFTGNAATNRGGGVYVASRCLLENCTVAANAATSAAGFYGSATAVTVLNSIVHANLGPNVSNRYTNVVFAYSCTEPAIAGTGNLTNDPAFLLPAAGNFRLGTASLCRDAGTNQAWMAAGADLAGQPRLAAGTVDLGAYETGPLAADFDAAPRLGVAPLEVVLTAAAAGTNVEALAYRWDFQDDGAFDAAGASATNTYAGGLYSVRLVVSNAAGETAAVVKTNWIAAQGGVGADFTADVRTGAAPFVVRFTDLSANDPQFWAWDFDADGAVDSTDQNPEWTFAATGQFTVALAVSNDFGDGNGSADSVVKTNYVSVPVFHLVADFTVAPTQALTYESLQFTDASSKGPTHWTWYFRNVGDGDSFEQNPTSHYTAAGYKTVKLVVSNDWSTAVAVKTNVVRIAGPSPLHYVAADGGNVAPFTNWSSAARSIDAALAAADVFDTVLVSNGTYGVPFLGLSCAGMTLASVNGPGVTVVTGAGSENVLRASSVREEPTFIAGFTFADGYASGDGAGLWITRNVVVSNC